MSRTPSAPLWQWSACDLAGAIRAGDISAHEVVSAVVDRVRAENPRLNAIVEDLSVAALETAHQYDADLAAYGPRGPLHGVPVTIKVNVDQTGHATTNGVTAFKDVIAPDDAPIVRNLKNAGAIVIGRTNTPEFSFRATTDNPLHGRTLNPWDDQRSPGGSSGGASAALAAGFGPLAHGNDIGGSLRFPAFMCGLATIRPTFGRVPAYNPSAPAERSLLAQMMSTQGVIARETRDVRLGTRVMAAPDPRDPWQAPVPFDGPALNPPIKVAVARATNGYAIDPAVTAALDRAAEALAAAEQGADCLRINPGNIGSERKVAEVIACARHHGIPIRVGVNAGSLEKDLQEKYGEPNSDALVESAFRHIDILDRHDFQDFKISLKASEVFMTVFAYRKLAAQIEQPLHLGITEAGGERAGAVKSSIGLGMLLADGIGDTIRVSLAADPVQEIKVGWDMLKSLHLRSRGINLIACPSCSRQNFDVIKTVNELEARFDDIDESMDVAVIGCVVNGPGEAREAHIGVTGGNPNSVFVDGKIQHKLKNEDLVIGLEDLVRQKIGKKPCGNP
ncbi:MAG: flavodoxin-dependent (E)-4-hydroxy-3-methylbut-2-enyl-diphosphate synthase [Thalassobaculaceae bacterium]